MKEPPVTIPIYMCLKKVTSNKRNAGTGEGCVCFHSNLRDHRTGTPRTEQPLSIFGWLSACWGKLNSSKPGNVKCSSLLKQYQSSFNYWKLQNKFFFFFFNPPKCSIFNQRSLLDIRYACVVTGFRVNW